MPREIKARSDLGRLLCRDEFSIPNDVNIGKNIDNYINKLALIFLFCDPRVSTRDIACIDKYINI